MPAAQWLRAGSGSADPEVVHPVAVALAEALRREGSETEAAAWLEESAAAGYVPAMALLGSKAADDRDWDTAERWCMQAARAGYPGAAGILGAVLEAKGEPRRAALWLQAALNADQSAGSQDPATAAALGRVSRSLGDLAEAERWLRLAAEQGHPEAADQHAEVVAERARQAASQQDGEPGPDTLAATADAQLAEGIAAEQREDRHRALSCYRTAAMDGSADGAYRYGSMLQADGDDDSARRWLRMAAERGHPEAAADLVSLVSDPLEFLHWLNAAATADHPVALRGIAAVRLVANQPEEAEDYYRRSAEAGDLIAATALGGLLAQRGETGQARYWLTCAANGGSVDAAHNLGVLSIGLDERSEAMAWFRRSAEAERVPSMLALARLLSEDGDVEQAETWLTRAFDAGSSQGAAELALIKYQQSDRAGALKWARAAAGLDHPVAAFMAGLLSYGDENLQEAEERFRVAAASGIAEAAVRLAALAARRGDPRTAEILLAGPVREADPHALYSVADLAARRNWMSVAESYFVAAAERGHLFAALDAAALADMRGSYQEKADRLRQWQSGRTMSSIALSHERDYRKIGLTIIRNAPWEPGQPVMYGLSLPYIQEVWINSESGLDQTGESGS